MGLPTLRDTIAVYERETDNKAAVPPAGTGGVETYSVTFVVWLHDRYYQALVDNLEREMM